MTALNEIKQLIDSLEALPESKSRDYFLCFAKALEESVMEPSPRSAMNGITPFAPTADNKMDSIALCFHHVTELAGADYAKSQSEGKLQGVLSKGLNAIQHTLNGTDESLLLHNLALNFSYGLAEQRLGKELEKQGHYKAHAKIADLNGLEKSKAQYDEREYSVIKDVGGNLVSAAQGMGDKKDALGRKRNIQEDHMMLALGDTIPAGNVPGKLLNLFHKVAEEAGQEYGGTTACVACVSDGKVTVANTGDSRAFLLLEPVDAQGNFDSSRDIKYLRLSAEHNPADAGEICRVQNAGGRHAMGHKKFADYTRILSPGEDNEHLSETPGIGVARAFGDKDFKESITWYPDMTQTDLKSHVEEGYRAHVCLCSDGMHYKGGMTDKKFKRGLNETDYAALLKAFREQKDPPAYDNLAKLFSDYARWRRFDDNRSIEVITYDPASKKSISAGVFDGHMSQELPKKAAEIIGNGLGTPVPLANTFTITKEEVHVISPPESDPHAAYRIHIDITGLDQWQRKHLRQVLEGGFQRKCEDKTDVSTDNVMHDFLEMPIPYNDQLTQSERRREAEGARNIIIIGCREFLPKAAGPAAQRLGNSNNDNTVITP